MGRSGRRAKEPPQARVSPVPPAWLAPALWAGLLACLAFLCLTKITDNDVWWHLRAGQWIVRHWQVPRVDFFSYTIAGRPWLPFEWLSQVLFYAAYAAGGLPGLTILKAAAIAATFAVMAVYGETRRAAEAPVLCMVLALAAWSARIGFVERPQVFTFLLTAVSLLVLQRAQRRPALLWLLPALQVLWTNLHGGAGIVGLALIGCWWAASPTRPLTLALLGAAAASLLNPSGAQIYAHLFGTIGFSARASINEWTPLPYDRTFATVWMPLIALEAVSLAAWLSNGRRRLAEGLLWAAFLILSLRATRFAVEAALVFGQLAAGNLGPALEAWRPARRVFAGICAAALLFMGVGTWACQRYGFPGQFRPGLGAAPNARAAIEFMDRTGLKGHLFNSFELGGQVAWYAPDRPVFVDGRTLEYGPDFIRDAVDWFQPETWKRLDARYHFQIALVQNGPYYLCGALDDDPHWALVYWDDEALVYVRRGGDNAAQAARGYRLLRPNETDFSYLQSATPSAALAEAQRSIAAAPRAVTPLLLAADLLRQSGRPREALGQSQAAIRLDSTLPAPYYEAALDLEALGRPEEARRYYRECLARAGASANAALAAAARGDTP